MLDGPLLLAGRGLFVAAALLTAVPAAANESVFSFVMHERHVNGKRNGVTHGLSTGTLGVSVEMEPCQYSAKEPADQQVIDPLEVTIEIWEQGFLDKLVCSFNIKPSWSPGKKVFSTPCRPVPSAVFYVVAYRGRSESCTVSATGRLVTR